MSTTPKEVDGQGNMSPVKNVNNRLFTFSNGEAKFREEFADHKERMQRASGCTPRLYLLIARNVKEDLKKLFKETRQFKSLRLEIRQYVIDEVHPTIKRLSKEEEEKEKKGEEKNIVTDVEDPKFNFYPNSSEEEKEDDEEEKVVVEENEEEGERLKKWPCYEPVEIIDIKENQTGLTFEKIFTKERIGDNVTQVLLEDPYLHTRDQLRVLMRFILSMRYTYNEFCQIHVRTKLNSGRSFIYRYLKEKHPEYTHARLIEMEHDEIDQNLIYVKKKCADKGIEFTYKFVSSMHDRLIIFNSGIMAIPGRGIGIYQMSDTRFVKDWDRLRCKGCRIQIHRLKGFNVARDDIYKISI
uniref:MIT_C domain-containing protein n=1 Tax=Strongyloides venezuelensis TaxID=75913 RepID=A0A0K0FQ98_STRVS